MLAAINGSGPHGRVVASDVEKALASGTATPAVAEEPAAAPAAHATEVVAAPVVSGDFTDYPLSEGAQLLAHQLTQQKLDVPHYHLTADLTLDKLLQGRNTTLISLLGTSEGLDSLFSVVHA